MAGGRCRILVVEDDRETADQLKDSLAASGYQVDLAVDGREGLSRGRTAEYAVMTVDRMLPDIDGLAVIRRLREDGIVTPALIVSALGEIDDRVRGLRAGGDDYLVKPFAMKELLARLRALSRRTDQPKSSILSYADLSLDTRTHQVRRNGKLIPLALKEFSVLECLLREPGRVLSRAQIAEHVWSYESFNQSNVVDVYVRNLRRKIDEPFEQKLIYTVRGVGYCLAIYETD